MCNSQVSYFGIISLHLMLSYQNIQNMKIIRSDSINQLALIRSLECLYRMLGVMYHEQHN